MQEKLQNSITEGVFGWVTDTVKRAIWTILAGIVSLAYIWYRSGIEYRVFILAVIALALMLINLLLVIQILRLRHRLEPLEKFNAFLLEQLQNQSSQQMPEEKAERLSDLKSLVNFRWRVNYETTPQQMDMTIMSKAPKSFLIEQAEFYSTNAAHLFSLDERNLAQNLILAPDTPLTLSIPLSGSFERGILERKISRNISSSGSLILHGVYDQRHGELHFLIDHATEDI